MGRPRAQEAPRVAESHFVPLFVSLGAVIDKPYESKTLIDRAVAPLTNQSHQGAKRMIPRAALIASAFEL